jgi:hypothetical protein
MQRALQHCAAATGEWFDSTQGDEAAPDEDMGAMERRLERSGNELKRAELQRMVQEKASKTPPECPKCGATLARIQWREIPVMTRFGTINVSRDYGWCPKCKAYFAPADHVLGIASEGRNSPEMAEHLQLLGTIMPPGQAETISEKLYGFRIDDCRIADELERGGREETSRRKIEDEQALCTQGRWEITRRIEPDIPEGAIMIIQGDGFMGRERDDWGRTDEMRAQGHPPERWHEIKAGTIFLLADRTRSGGKSDRPVILRRTFLATRGNAYEFGQMLFAEAVRQGMLLAEKTYFVADGGIWLWNIHKERFPHAEGTLDIFHAAQHIWAVAHARYGEGEEAKRWAEPLVHQLRHGGEAGVLRTLKDLAQVVEEIEPKKRNADDDTIMREWEYFRKHRKHLGYESKSKAGLPIGSGCIESTCKQYQLRVKRCGQFWSTENLEGLLCLYSRHLSSCWN